MSVVHRSPRSAVPQISTTSYLILSALPVLLSSTGASERAAEADSSTERREALLRKVEAARGRIQDLQVTFTFNATRPIPSDAIKSSKVTVVIKGSKTYIDRRFTDELKSPSYKFRRVVAYNGKRSTLHEASRGVASVKDGRENETLTHELGFFVLNLLNAPREDGRGYDDQSLISLLRNPEAEVKSKEEVVNGRSCQVVETRMLTVWIDTERLVPLRQVFHGGTEKAIMEFVVEKVAKVSPGLWFATRGRHIVYPRVRIQGIPPDGAEKVVRLARYKPSIAVNTGVDDRFFDLWKRLPPGTRLWDQDTDETRIVSVGDKAED